MYRGQYFIRPVFSLAGTVDCLIGRSPNQRQRFQILKAKERVNEQGVRTRTLSRKGNVREEIKKAAVEIGATLVLLGHPEGGASAFQLSNLQAFADEIKDETGIEVRII